MDQSAVFTDASVLRVKSLTGISRILAIALTNVTVPVAAPIPRFLRRQASLRLTIGREVFHPVPGNFLAAADPDLFLSGHVIQETTEGLRPCRAPGYSAMQAN
jgi:hypothetical protein